MIEEKTFDEVNNESNKENAECFEPNDSQPVLCEQESETAKISDSEIVVEDDNEGYKLTKTGINIKYVLSESEITEIFKHTEGYRKNRSLQKRHTTIQSILFIVLLILWLVFKNKYYGYLMIIPIICIFVIWALPLLSIRRLAKEFFSGEEINAEVYPDKIKLKLKDKTREIKLNHSVKHEEIGGMILLYPEGESTVMIPIRAIDSKDLPDVQAMIFAGASPKRAKE